MSWYDGAWRHRQPFVLYNANGAAALDATLTVPSDFTKFWGSVQPDLDDLRVTKADGVSLLTYKIVSLDYSAKTVQILVDNYDFGNLTWGTLGGAAGRSVVGHLYWGNDAASHNVTPSASVSNAVEMNFDISAPGSANAPVLRMTGQSAGQTTTTHTVVKAANDRTRVYWDLYDLMLRRSHYHSKSLLLEEIAWVSVSMATANGSAQNAMLTASSVTVSNPYIVQHEILGGSTGTNYLITLLVGTDDGAGGTRVLELRATLKVRDLVADTT